MDFFVNGQNFDITIEDEKTIGDVLKSFQIYCDENDAAVIGIKINENLVTADNFDDVIGTADFINSKEPYYWVFKLWETQKKAINSHEEVFYANKSIYRSGT